jgi:hypothetical protein
MKEVMRPDESQALGPSVIGLQCAGRTLGDFQRDLQAGVRDAVALYEDHILIVRTPPNPGLRTALKAMRGGAASVVPHERILRSNIVAAGVVNDAPPDWRLLGDLTFLRLSTRDGDHWHWIDTGAMQGKDVGLAEMLATYPRGEQS